ncbi:MAG TPA: hypothetical protein VJ861_11565 [Treponemataceae bacterium]|nr:hypothetical protein [Treponemataceae bacterium]
MKKKLLSIALVSIFALTVVSAQDAELAKFNDALTGFLGEVNDALPDNAVVGGTWSDAYIGQIVGIPPHFGIGLAVGVSQFPVKALKEAVALTGAKLPIEELGLPNVALEGRIGGFILPFDIGFRVGGLPKQTLKGAGLELLNFGVDVRYALLKDNLIMPGISVGLGYYHSSGAISYTFNTTQLTAVEIPAGYTVEDQELKIDFGTNVIEAKAQVSKNLIFITPYAGAAVYTAITESTYTLASETNTANKSSFGMRVFGGTSINLLVLKLDVSGMYNVLSQNWGGNVGLRVQL